MSSFLEDYFSSPLLWCSCCFSFSCVYPYGYKTLKKPHTQRSTHKKIPTLATCFGAALLSTATQSPSRPSPRAHQPKKGFNQTRNHQDQPTNKMEMPPTKRQRVILPASEEDFRDAGGRIMNRDPEGRSEVVFERQWLSFFGVCVATVVATWNLLQITVGDPDFEGAKPHHLLWGLLFLKKYGDESEMAALVGDDGVAVDEGTFRKWSHLFVERVSYLLCDVIIWENRKVGDIGNDCLVSVDGTDCKIQWQSAAPKAWNSHKFRGPGVRYEVAVCILTGEIVWVIGPFPCGDWPDIVIFRFALKQLLDDNERVEADDGYVGEDPVHIKVPGSMIITQ